MDIETTGVRIRKLREKRGLSQEELAKIIGVSWPSIVFWE